jgi:NOL1/NOP2/sun family putative RNA methylase
LRGIQDRAEYDRLIDSLLGRESRRLAEFIAAPIAPHFRFNPLKHEVKFQKRLLRESGFQFEAVTESAGIFRTRSQSPPLGKSLSHFLGHLYIQDLSSMLPPLVLDPQPGSAILDMCAAPGSKTTQLAALLQGGGTIAANDSSRRRLRTLIGNLKRMGTPNVVVFNLFGEQLGNLYFERFDGVLLDPPCSALGTLHKNPEVLSWWGPERSRKLALNQRNLLHSGLKALKPGGRLVYSTCTLTPEENEAILQFALERFPVELEEIRLPAPLNGRPALSRIGGDRLDPTIQKALRIYSFDNESDGFFIASLKKSESFGADRNPPERLPFDLGWGASKTHGPAQEALERLSGHFELDRAGTDKYLFFIGSQLMAACAATVRFPLFAKPEYTGIPIAHFVDGQIKITTEGVNLIGGFARRNTMELQDLKRLAAYVNRIDLPVAMPDSAQSIVRLQGHGIGHGFVEANRLVSRFPRSGWEFHFPDDGQCTTEPRQY